MPLTDVLARFLARRSALRPSEVIDLDPPERLWAVGDVHGCVSLCRAIERRIADEALPVTIVWLGDLIDRGPDSRSVIEHMLAPPRQGISRHCLLGNHEDMALRFLDAPLANRDWLGFGGRETLASYGVPAGAGEADPATLAERFREVLPAPHLAFLRSRPVRIRAGRHFLTHAGEAAQTPLVRQTRADLIWPRHAAIPDLVPPVDLGGRIVVHGHVPVAIPRAEGWRINVDTGAFATGRLSAVRLSEAEAPRFLTVEGPPA